VGQHSNVINAAKEAGVERLIYTSILKADTSPLLIAPDHKATEAIIKESGLTYTMLRNSWYTENWTGGLATSTPATRQDLGEAIAAAAIGSGHENKTYELAGTPFTLADMAAELSAQVGKDIPYNDLPPAAYAEILDGFGLPKGFSAVIADADSGAQNGWLFDDSNALATLINRPPTTLKDAVAAALA